VQQQQQQQQQPVSGGDGHSPANNGEQQPGQPDVEDEVVGKAEGETDVLLISTLIVRACNWFSFHFSGAAAKSNHNSTLSTTPAESSKLEANDGNGMTSNNVAKNANDSKELISYEIISA
jgi:hypothetical protein